MSKRFFKPFVGKLYHEGIQGKRVLVLGASFYCNKTDCQFFKQCTDVNKKDSSAYDSICPAYAKENKLLSNEPSYCIIDYKPRTYQIFANCMQSLMGADGYKSTWERMAFTNYIQFFLPATDGVFRDTRASDMSERDFEVFIETLKELQPHIVIVWGCVINSCLKQDNPYLVSKKELGETEWYLCHIQVPGVNHKIAILNPFHPSSSHWNKALPVFKKYIDKAIAE